MPNAMRMIEMAAAAATISVMPTVSPER
jgi:hypothetical protein